MGDKEGPGGDKGGHDGVVGGVRGKGHGALSEVEKETMGVVTVTAAAEEDSELIVVNGKEVAVSAELHVKSKLSQFCQKLQIPNPTYDVTVVKAKLQYFIATVKADERSALGTGRSKKMAQTVAARSFLNKRFLPGNYNSQAGTPVCNPGVNPAKKKRQIKQMGNWVENQEMLRNQESKSCEVIAENYDLEQPGQTQTGKTYIYFDVERAGGNIESEIIQIGYTDGDQSESSFIQPKGNISKQSSKHSHKMSLNKSGKLVNSAGVLIKCISLFEAAEKFITYIKVKKEESGEDVSLVFYGGDDDICLFNNLAVVKLDQALVENVGSFFNFQEMIKDDDQFKEVSVSLVKLQPNKKNISQQILGPKINKELKMSHDACYDADLLSRVFREYFKSWSYAVELRPYMIPSRDSLQIAQSVVGRLSEKRLRKGSEYDFLTFNGWK